MELNGFVNIIKPTGMTSSDVVLKVKKILNTKKVGHLGTLDPAASGVLPIAVGKATKFFDYFLAKDKEYVALVQFGIETDSGDSFGNIIKTSKKIVEPLSIYNAIPSLLGEIEQTPPKYSAVKINGKRACDLARENVNFEIKSRKINIFSIDLLKKVSENQFLFKVHCSAGTYIRTLFMDMARLIGTVASVPVIIRTKSGLFDKKTAITLEELENSKQIISINDIFCKLKHITVGDVLAKMIINGNKFIKNENNFFPEDEDFFIDYNGTIVGLFFLENEMLKRRVFLYQN